MATWRRITAAPIVVQHGEQGVVVRKEASEVLLQSLNANGMT
jgi:hypothetical protein